MIMGGKPDRGIGFAREGLLGDAARADGDGEASAQLYGEALTVTAETPGPVPAAARKNAKA